ncbi:MAG TPA: hypothetical protein VMF35_16030 [Acidimicrobiales bacterium]|nr:hypothetical protein [Acidimicrobiales bacterium]
MSDLSMRQSPRTEGTEELERAEAVRQIRRRRHFHFELFFGMVGMTLLVVIWATTEYHNAGGWPTQGFSQSSGIHEVWNYWIVYPLGAWILILAGRAWWVYKGHKPITAAEIEHEVNRQKDTH